MGEGSRRKGLHSTIVIQKKADDTELNEAKKWPFREPLIAFLDGLFEEVYRALQPSAEDYQARETIISYVEKIVNDYMKGCGVSISGPFVRPYGSYLMDLFTPESDLDLSVNVGYSGDVVPREVKIELLDKLARPFNDMQGKKVRNFQCIFTAVVPILKFVDCRYGIECDISIENNDGLQKSKLIRVLSKIDERFPKLCYLVKRWAKAKDINSSRDRTLNSLSLILLVAVHLQTRKPPILPPFSVFLEAGCEDSEIERRVLEYQSFGSKNSESVSQLFISLMSKLISVEPLWKKGLCASAYEGCWISKQFEHKATWMGVEDFSIRSQNAARSVGKFQRNLICQHMRDTLSRLKKCSPSSLELSNLKTFLFNLKPKSEKTLASSPSLELKSENILAPSSSLENFQYRGKRKMPFDDTDHHKRLHEERKTNTSRQQVTIRHSDNTRAPPFPQGTGIPVISGHMGLKIPGQDDQLLQKGAQSMTQQPGILPSYRHNPIYGSRFDYESNSLNLTQPYRQMEIQFPNWQPDTWMQARPPTPFGSWQRGERRNPEAIVPFQEPRRRPNGPLQHWQAEFRRPQGSFIGPPDWPTDTRRNLRLPGAPNFLRYATTEDASSLSLNHRTDLCRHVSSSFHVAQSDRSFYPGLGFRNHER